jgi:hypothetical protein
MTTSRSRLSLVCGHLILLVGLYSHSLEAQVIEKQSGTEEFVSEKYGLKTRLPKAWPLLAREKNEYVFVCEIPQAKFPDRPGIMACELAMAPESLDEYRTRIDANAKRGGRKGSLVKNEVKGGMEGGLPERLESVWEFRLPTGEVWHEITVRVIRGRHLYSYVLNIENDMLQSARGRFDRTIAATAYSPPDAGARVVEGAKTNRFMQTEFHFVVDLPEGWAPLLAPNEIAILYANGKPKGIWADNMLVLARKPVREDYEKLSRTLAAELEAAEPGCKVKSCEVIRTKSGDPALQTEVEVRRGPFSMTILEWRFAGKRMNYELKFTVMSENYDKLKAEMVHCFESFQELPDEKPAEKKAQTE